MTSRRIGNVAVAIVLLAWAAPVQAGVIVDLWDSVCHDFKAKNCWPDAYLGTARQSVCEPLAIQAVNGWERQNMLADAHFDAGSGQLTEAGRLKVLSVLNRAPESHRTLYVHRADTPQETALRMQATLQFVAKSAYNNQTTLVLESNRSPDGTPADRIDMIGRKALAAIPDPKLPAGDGSSFGNSSSGGGH
jgi:hypothetical protein